MAVKPPQIRYVTEGKSLGAGIHRGWAATWNWLLSWVHHFTPGKGLKMKDASKGSPQIDVLIEGQDGINVKCAGPRQPYVIGLADDFWDGMDDGSRFHFAYSKTVENNTTTVTIGEGVVNIGGYSYFSGGGTVSNMGGGTKYICAVVALGAGTVTFAAYASTSAINSAQSDMSKYIFPLYKTVDYVIVLDFRPMPNAGCWEIAESVGSGSSGSSGGAS